jgi:hypothetical protein
MNGAWLQFAKAVNEHHQVSNSDISDLLVLIQAPSTLQSLLHHIPLLPETLEMAVAVAKKSGMDASRFQKSLNTANLLATVVAKLEEDLKYRNFRAPVPVPRFGPCEGLFGSHPLYSALAETTPYKNTHKRFVHLKAHILLAMESLREINQALLDILHVPFTNFRALTKPNNKDLLAVLPDTPMAVDTFGAIIKAVFQKTKFRPVCKIFEVTETSLNLRKSERKKPVRRKGTHPKPVSEDDEVPTDKYLKDALPTTILTPKESEEYIDQGGLPEELGSNIDLEPVLAPDQYHGPTLRQLAFQAQQGHNRRSMINQFCSMAWNQANLFDVKILFEFLEGRKLLGNVDYQPLTREDVIVILGLMFFTCNSMERILSLPVYPGCNPRPDSGEGVYLQNGHPVQVRLKSSGPDLSGPREFQGAIAASQYSTIRLPPFFTRCLEQISNPLLTGQERYFLIKSIDPTDEISRNSALSALRNALGELNSSSGARLSLGRISSYLLFRVADSEKSDLPGAMLYFGRNEKFARTRVHYTLADTRQLSAAYRNCINTLLSKIRVPGLFDAADSVGGKDYLGTPFCPKVETVQKLAEDLRAKLNDKSLTMVQRHNYFALYTSMLISYGTGYRAIHDPSFREVEIDPKRGLGVIADKGTANYRTRYVYLAPVVLEQIRFYRKHMQTLYNHLGVINPSLFDLVKTNDCAGLPLNLFLLAGDFEPLELLSPRKAREILKDEFKYTIALNAGRHYLKYHLIKAGCSPELVEAQLGHWEAGQEPWGPYSNLDPLDFVQQLAVYIPGILMDSGWVAVDGGCQ